ncbi:MAG TPA: 30S ribosomal protein S5 [Candidatus Marinimicrobia bacterium]|nr:30S ribosomal protein S5 [Candidatus Neomarinimicrobiota bacterium]MDP6275441.1 30S ribosomal protein S5 [Candidatus Neomarinimicrobiota bacterium]MDP7217094.1 30S ribosomal protein S5 [Candidatus Neomarinimicrobiota bacterium]HBN45794.1 30S ribosomal protein S5 [Candidatus Neomarinimicrobiota bacterium]HJL75193.1 30S ribosomal protein S5 [Candidatus Neomarinimicrobiota bacterium]
MAIINPAELDLKEETVIRINRVAKVTSRGKRFRFSALVVVGDGNGHVGIGLGKANEVMGSIAKAKDNAKRNIFKAPILNDTIPHKITGKHGASRVMLKPASPGTGIIAGAAVRLVMEQVGVNNILSKRYGSNNTLNVVRATINALENLQDAVSVANKRGMTIKEVFS